MEWVQAIREAVRYMEEHLTEDISAEDVAASVYFSAFYFQKGFHMLSGYTVGEYLRNRRLYLAALDLLSGEKVVDVSLKYGYDTPESFSKAFRRFHGVLPAQVKQQRRGIRPFLPLTIEVSVKGGNAMDYVIEEKQAFRVIGIHRRFCAENSFEEIPKYWDEVIKNEKEKIYGQLNGRCNVGRYGICMDDADGKTFEYWIAGDYDGGTVPDGLDVLEIPENVWAKFNSTGALQRVNTQIFSEWLPGNPEWEFAANYNLEIYHGDDVHTEIWIPVKRREG